MQSNLLLTGVGLRAPHYSEMLEKKPGLAWLEVHSENYFSEGGRPLHLLQQIRQDYPISLHGVSLSPGSADDLNWAHLKQLKDLAERIDACLISDHLAWSSINGQYLHDLLPVPYTQETLDYMAQKIQQAQDYLKRQIIIENISSYLSHPDSSMTEWDFLVKLATQAGCGILLDVNNIYVSSCNLGFDPNDFLAGIPGDLVQEIHLGGFESTQIDGSEVLIDTHSQAIVPAVWDLYRQTITRIGRKPTIIEWDSSLPGLDTLCLEAFRAEKIMRECYDTAKLTG